MRVRRRAWWLLLPLAGLTFLIPVFNPRDAFDELGPPEPETMPVPSHRRWKLPGTELEAKRRVEAILARDGRWTLVSIGIDRADAGWLRTSYRYSNPSMEADCTLWYIAARKPNDRVFLDVNKPTGWTAFRRRFALWWHRQNSLP